MSRHTVVAFCVSLAFPPFALAGETHDHHAHHPHLSENAPAYARSTHRYSVPAVPVRDQDGRMSDAARLLAIDGPMMVNVIYTTCTSVCPIMTRTFAQTHAALGEEAKRVTFVSITNDPSHDTPAVLKAYTRAHGVPDGWRFLTGDDKAITALLRAFDAHRGGKMNHQPLTFLRAGRNEPWVRLEGLTSPQQLVAEYRKLVH